ncbi:MAG: uracil-DNA glycosylase [Ignavibacterium sp.]|jgi:DNA polymerase
MPPDRSPIERLLSDVQKFLAQQEELNGELLLPAKPRVDLEKTKGFSAETNNPAAMQPVQEDELFPDAPVMRSGRSQGMQYPAEEWVQARDLQGLNEMICTCLKCSLGQTRTKFVFGVGNPKADLVLVGEAPGADEDLQGEPFVGRAGQLLNKILEAIRFKREDVYICNILKCRPPNNRDPQPEEIALCEPYLWKQLELIKPRLILCLGRIAAQALLKTSESLTALRGRVHDYRGIKLMVTYHPAALLRNPNWKRPTWEDVQKVRKLYDELTAGA